jgi:transposase
VIAERAAASPEVALLSSIPGVGGRFTALALACRVGQAERFRRGHSLANYWGLTPGCRNSGDDRRLGSITKAGSATARWLLAQLVHKVLRKDARLREWFKRIKRRRGARIARVAVMRKLATIIWHVLRKRQTYAACRALAAA